MTLSVEELRGQLDEANRNLHTEPPGVEVSSQQDGQEDWEAARFLSRTQLRDIEAPAELIGGNILYQGTAAWLVGDSGTYKSFVALDWALSVAMGRSWLGHPVKQGAVLYLVGEGMGGMSKRVDAWEHARGVEVDDQFTVMRPADLLDTATRLHLVAAVERHGFDLLVIDTQARATPGANENDKGEMDRFVTLVGHLANEAGCTVLTIHHSSKAGSPMRGSGSIYGAADTIHILKRPENTTLQCELLIEKQKDTESGEVLNLDLTPTLDSLTVDMGVIAEAEDMGFKRLDDEHFRRIVHSALAQLVDVGTTGLTKPELKDGILEAASSLHISCSRRDAYRAIDHVVKHNYVTHLGGRQSESGVMIGGRLMIIEAGRQYVEWSKKQDDEAAPTIFDEV